ncbi:MAG: tRNA preQ1(34) S-adenosylmethionine ribosyltransferase-isomerase QueA [Deltaproteobacteria bacterium]|nr:tRNA preQ1(34) S-adenosylmethionine ribosyltransferase-isomerase QueA [Deltaproteobacteria bacterium]
MFDVNEYDYDLPEHLIAQAPAEMRDLSRLLVVDRNRIAFSDQHFFDLPRLLKPGDLLVVNNTRVVPARLFGRKESGGQAEILVLEHPRPESDGGKSRFCLLKSSKRPKEGSLLFFDKGVTAVVEEVTNDGLLQVRFEYLPSLEQYLEEEGAMPVPPYIRRKDREDRASLDKERYQTVFSKVRGAVAAPTAGLHFTEELGEKLAENGISLAEITLHVGYSTFRPVRARDIREHSIGEEEFRIEAPAAAAINKATHQGRRVIAVGTTVVRVLETVAQMRGTMTPMRGKTDLLITPGYSFRVIQGLITNFHLPRSSLLFLVSAFAGRERILMAYRHAVQESYRFYSYGDAMLIV